jgi:hypothetical protein
MLVSCDIVSTYGAPVRPNRTRVRHDGHLSASSRVLCMRNAGDWPVGTPAVRVRSSAWLL